MRESYSVRQQDDIHLHIRLDDSNVGKFRLRWLKVDETLPVAVVEVAAVVVVAVADGERDAGCLIPRLQVDVFSCMG